MSLAALAAEAGCTKGYLSQIENGKRAHPPSQSLLARLEAALGIEDRSLRNAAAWDETPGQVREELRRLHGEVRRLSSLVPAVYANGRREQEGRTPAQRHGWDRILEGWGEERAG